MNNFTYIIHLAVTSLALLLGVLLRNKVRFLQKYLIPASLIGGFFLLLFYNFVGPHIGLTNDFLGDLVYHLLNISFISMMLRIPETSAKKKSKAVKQNVIALASQYGFQCLLGLLVTALMIHTFAPGLSPAFGYTLALGFELGPGQAYSMSLPWESMGFSGASSVGLAMAATGFLVGSVGGVILINIAIRRKWLSQEQIDKLHSREVKTSFVSSDHKPGAILTTNSEAIDSFTYHIALVGMTYLLSYGVLSLISYLLSFFGSMGVELAESLWGINFVFSVFSAIIVRKIMVAFNLEKSIDNLTLNRINGLAVDFTVCASLGAIVLSSISQYWLPILILIVTGIGITCFLLPWYCSRLFTDNQFYRTLMIFGTATGTLPTGMSLLRIVDPDFETPVAQDFVYATGIMLPLAIPIILTINLPAFSVTKGKPILFWAAVGISALYAIISIIFYVVMAKKRSFADKSKFFFVDRATRNEVK
ncbi:MAG: sodium/glutamate symporter [Sphaerochaetaceae bacterium]